MANNNVDLMKQLIANKKSKEQSNSSSKQPIKQTGSTQKAFKNLKRGGAFDK